MTDGVGQVADDDDAAAADADHDADAAVADVVRDDVDDGTAFSGDAEIKSLSSGARLGGAILVVEPVAHVRQNKNNEFYIIQGSLAAKKSRDCIRARMCNARTALPAPSMLYSDGQYVLQTHHPSTTKPPEAEPEPQGR